MFIPASFICRGETQEIIIQFQISGKRVNISICLSHHAVPKYHVGKNIEDVEECL